MPSVSTTAIACDADAIGAIRYNTATSAFEGCNGVAWADIRNGATATAAGSTGQVQFNSGGAFGGSANFTWDNVHGSIDLAGVNGLWQDNTNRNTAVGDTALPTTVSQAGGGNNGQYNFAAGYQALNANTTGLFNLALGLDALQKTTTGAANTAVGPFALQYNITGSSNTAIGYAASSVGESEWHTD